MDDKKIIIFGGTTEGRIISERLSVEKIFHTVCVATEYGEMLLKDSKYAYIRDGRMDEKQMSEFVAGSQLIIDATHPYATLVTDNIKKAASENNIRLVRIQRDETETNNVTFDADNGVIIGSCLDVASDDKKQKGTNYKDNLNNARNNNQNDKLTFFDSMNELSDFLSENVEVLCGPEGNILLTTGSKDLEHICSNVDRKRIYVRVLPSRESIALCEKSGITNNHIIALHGPFSTELNRALIRQYNIKLLITKESGTKGGYQEKVDAALLEGAKILVIRRPVEEKGYSIDEAVNIAVGLHNLDSDKIEIQISLAGLGPGGMENITGAVSQAIASAEAVFGAERLLAYVSDKNTYPYYSARDILPIIIREGYHRVTVLFSGDTGFYSGAKAFNDYVEGKQNEYGNVRVNIIPGISSVSYLSAKIGIPYSNTIVTSLHGRNSFEYIRKAAGKILRNKYTYLIFSNGDDIKTISRELSECLLDDGYLANDGIGIFIGRNLSYDDESIEYYSLTAIDNILAKGLYVACFVNNISNLQNDIRVNKKDSVVNKDRLLVAAARSGSGKTMLTCALLNILKQDARRVTAYKCGPDYIDPMFHRNVLGVGGGNLDTCFCSGQQIREIIANSEYENGIIEGVMGIYDGIGGTSIKGSSYDVAVKSASPILLLVDAGGQGTTVMSTIKGILNDDYYGMIKGIIINRISERFYNKLLPLLEAEIKLIRDDVVIVGFIPKLNNIEIKSRHLGLLMPEEICDLNEKINVLSNEIRKHCDLDKIYELMKCAGPLVLSDNSHLEDLTCTGTGGSRSPRLAVARDEAFCFYYEENISLFKEMGVDIVEFSPCRDTKLPDNIDGILLGGGYPENHLELLESNTSMRASIKNAIANGIPTLAECGGFMYLHDGIYDREGKIHEMCGIVEGSCNYTGTLKRFGYVQICDSNTSDSFINIKGMKGHEFHYYDSSNNGKSLSVHKIGEDVIYKSMHIMNNAVFGFMHMYYRSKPEFVSEFVEKMKNVRR